MRSAALAALAWGSACGGNVVVDGMPDGSGGAGATSSSAITAGATTNGAVGVATSVGAVGVATSVGAVGVGGSDVSAVGVGGSDVNGAGGFGPSGSSSTGVGGSAAWSTCVDFCERYEESCGGVEPGQCGTMCDMELSRAPRCNDLLVPYFDCLNDNRFDCNLDSHQCQQFLNQYNACASGDRCLELECAGGDGACTCKGACQGSFFAVECRDQGFGRTSCSCFVNGAEVGGCEDTGPTCNLAERCCRPYFAEFR